MLLHSPSKNNNQKCNDFKTDFIELSLQSKIYSNVINIFTSLSFLKAYMACPFKAACCNTLNPRLLHKVRSAFFAFTSSSITSP